MAELVHLLRRRPQQQVLPLEDPVLHLNPWKGGQTCPSSSLTRRHSLVIFFTLAFLISWLPYPAYAARWLAEPLFLPFGPLVAAVAVAGLSEGRAGLRRHIWRRAQQRQQVLTGRNRSWS